MLQSLAEPARRGKMVGERSLPFVQVYAYAGRTPDQKRRLVEGITRAVCDAYDVTPETVAIYLHDMDKGDTAHGGVLGSDADDR